MSERASRLTSLVIVVGFVLLMALYYLWVAFGFMVMDCTQPDTAMRVPAIKVEVFDTRDGHLTERHLLGCTFYDYEPPPFH